MTRCDLCLETKGLTRVKTPNRVYVLCEQCLKSMNFDPPRREETTEGSEV